MKNFICLIALSTFVNYAYAIDVIQMKKNVTFSHKAHQPSNPDCASCHGTKGPGKIDGFGKDFAHGKSCKGCHVKMKSGPITCKDCHPK